jgi:hypothetical protein
MEWVPMLKVPPVTGEEKWLCALRTGTDVFPATSQPRITLKGIAIMRDTWTR